MNKEELIAILQKRSQETLNETDQSSSDTEETHEKYLSRLKFRREEDKKNLRFGLIILFLVSIILFLIIKPAKNPIKNDPNYIKKDNLTFKDLPSSIRDNYVFKDAIEKSIKESQEEQKNKIIELEKEIVALKQLETQTFEEGSVTLDAITNRLKRYEATGCYIMNEGEDNLYDSCKIKINEFLKEIKDFKAKSFEIIAVMDGNDTNYISRVLNDINSSKINSNILKDNLKEGIARNRTLKASSYLKEKLGRDIIITYVGYIADTADKRGFTIRAYN